MNFSHYTPFVAVILNNTNGLRVAVEAKDISRYQEGHPHIAGSGNHYILYGSQQITINQYLKAIANTMPRFLEDFNENPLDLTFHIIKIGASWSSALDRSHYAESYNKKEGLLAYTYNITKETASDIDQAKNACFWKVNSVISLIVPVKIGCYILEGSSFPGGQFESIYEASVQTGLCLHKIVYRVFSQESDLEEWQLIRDQGQINKN